jgi:predicted nuclease with TOPRIM domain
MYLELLKKYYVNEYNEINKYLIDNKDATDTFSDNNINNELSNDEDLNKKLKELKIDNHVLDSCFSDLNKKVYKLMRYYTTFGENDKLEEILNDN